MADAVKPFIESKVVLEITLDGEFSLGELISPAQDKGVILNVPLREQPERDIYPKTMFRYDMDMGAYICPQGKQLKRCSENEGLDIYRSSSKTCRNCPVASECTESKIQVRTHRRDQYELEWELHGEYIQSNRYQFAKILRGILEEGKFLRLMSCMAL